MNRVAVQVNAVYEILFQQRNALKPVLRFGISEDCSWNNSTFLRSIKVYESENLRTAIFVKITKVAETQLPAPIGCLTVYRCNNKGGEVISGAQQN